MKFEILKKINSNTIISFAAGVIFTILFNLVVNKEPFKIDSDGISALANVGTFIVALMAALQVKRWLDGKVNEAAFKQSQLIIEAISKIHLYSRLILEDCKVIAETDILSAIYSQSTSIRDNATIALNELKTNIAKHSNTCKETNLQLQVLVYELPMWNITIKNEEVSREISLIVAATKIFTEECDEIQEQINKSNIHTAISISSKIVNETHPLLFEHLNPILTKNYHDIFSPITSPSKKDD
ncbi:hypothetical protein [Kluyvera ascorbata]|uniref:hypothetical protein n=1 Tax=Kluyvera ascorbata TaxID=51288 RepID=UPI00290698DD|nr:hypothetical protein [Kluyvera ascorbata]MDU3914346.1 hypothetical protein [Kluyvera ascorbata]